MSFEDHNLLLRVLLYQPYFAFSCLCGSLDTRMVMQLVDLLLWMDPISNTLGGKEHHTKNFLYLLGFFPLRQQRTTFYCRYFDWDLSDKTQPSTHEPVSYTSSEVRRNRPFKHSVHLVPRQTSQTRCLKIDKMNPFLKAWVLSRQRKNSSLGSSMQVFTDYFGFWNYTHEKRRKHQTSVLKIICIKGYQAWPHFFMQYIGKLFISSYINSI